MTSDNIVVFLRQEIRGENSYWTMSVIGDDPDWYELAPHHILVNEDERIADIIKDQIALYYTHSARSSVIIMVHCYGGEKVMESLNRLREDTLDTVEFTELTSKDAADAHYPISFEIVPFLRSPD